MTKNCWLALLGACAMAVPLMAADTPSPALLILNKEGALAIVDPATRQTVAKVRTGDGPHEVEASTDGKLAFVSNYGANTPGSTISVIDLVAQKELHRVDLGVLRRPHGLAYAGGKLYFTCETNKIVGRYDPATNQVDWLLGTGQNGTHMVQLNKEMNQIYIANIASNSIGIFDRTGAIDWNLTLVPVGKGPEGFDVTPDGKELWAAHSRDGGVSIINIFTKAVTHTFSVQTKRSNRLKFTPDGRLVLISDLDAGDLVVLERETRKQLKRLPVGKQLAGILVQPDGSKAYVAATGDNNVGVVDLKSLELVNRIQPGVGPDGMAWAVRQ
jgi:DNA-binding beta-propeller fold protein YncE